MNIRLLYVLALFVCCVALTCVASRFAQPRRDVIYIWPLWGIGNRLRTIRVCYALAQHLGKDVILVEHDDEGFQGSMSKLFGHPFGSVSKFHFEQVICRTKHIPIFEFNEECALNIDVAQLSQAGSFCIKACELKLKDAWQLMNDRSVYSRLHLHTSADTKELLNTVLRTNAVGVHVRQGNVNDWERGYFFNDEWKGIRERDPTSAPLMCCFKDESKNLSACTSNVTHLETYVNKMKEFPDTTTFFVCSDRPGCLLYLHQMFPNRILSNPPFIETRTIDTTVGMKDFVCLSHCTKILCSTISTFCNEASRVRDIPVILCGAE